jgi:NADH:ubiquinone oxidoreductase subunit C
VPASSLLALCRVLAADPDLQFDYLINITGTDMGTSYRMAYLLNSTVYQHCLLLHSDLDRNDDANIDSLVEIWKSANFHEREIFDLLGVKFSNHPDLRRIFLDDDWVGHPLRKDYTDEVNIVER